MKPGCTRCTRLGAPARAGGPGKGSAVALSWASLCTSLSLSFLTYPRGPFLRGLRYRFCKIVTCFEKRGEGGRGRRRLTFRLPCIALFPNPVSPPHPTHHRGLSKTFLKFLLSSPPLSTAILLIPATSYHKSLWTCFRASIVALPNPFSIQQPQGSL